MGDHKLHAIALEPLEGKRTIGDEQPLEIDGSCRILSIIPNYIISQVGDIFASIALPSYVEGSIAQLLEFAGEEAHQGLQGILSSIVIIILVGFVLVVHAKPNPGWRLQEQ